MNTSNGEKNKVSQDAISIDSNKLWIAALADSEEVFRGVQVNSLDVELPADADLSEFQYYIHKVGFYLVHTMTWCRQLSLAIEFLSNYDYSKKINSTKIYQNKCVNGIFKKLK